MLLATLLACLLGALWYMQSKSRGKTCSPRETQTDEEDLTQNIDFLLMLLVQSRWSTLAWKLMYRHRLRCKSLDQPPSVPAVPPRWRDGPTRAKARGAAALASMRGFTSAGVLALPDAPAPSAVPKEPPPPLPPSTVNPVHAQPEIPTSELLFAGRPWPKCPECKAQMVMRRNHKNGGSFWGCPQWPMCTGTRRPWDIDGGEPPAVGTEQPAP